MDQPTFDAPPPDADDIEALKPRKGALLLLIPVFIVFFVLVLYVVTWVVAVGGRTPDGPRVTLTWQGCAAAGPPILSRAQAIGLGEPELREHVDGFTLTATMPGDERIAAEIPDTLSERGQLEVRSGALMFDHTGVRSAAIRQDLTLIPWTVLTLEDDAMQRWIEAVHAEREGETTIHLDGKQIGRVSHLKGAGRELEFTSEDAENDQERLEKTAARTIVLGSGPLPCAVVRQ